MRALRLLGVSLPALALLSCSSSGNSGGLGGPSTTFKGAASGSGGTPRTVEIQVGTVSFSPPAQLFPTASNLAGTVSATVILDAGPNQKILNGTWDEANNTLTASGSGITIDGGYNVQSNQIGGTIDYGTGGSDDEWNGLKGKNATIYCGTWQVANATRWFALVIGGTIARGYGDEWGTPVDGTVSANTVNFNTGGFPGTATFGASGITGTVDGQSFTGSICG